MSNVASERVVNGIKTRVLHGKDYVEVAERVRIVQHDETAQGFSMVKQERYEWNERHFISVTIEVKGKLYIGDAEVTFGAPKNTPAGTSPVETAQTSALGRALAFAGYGTVESIASFDEVYRAISLEQGGRPVIEAAPSQRQLDAPKAAPGTEHLVNGNGSPAFPAKDTVAITRGELFERGEQKGMWTRMAPGAFYAMASAITGRAQSKQDWTMTADEMAEMARQIEAGE